MEEERKKSEEEIIKLMLSSNVHFGHRKRYSNPYMNKFMLGRKNDINIFNLKYTIKSLNASIKCFKRIIESGGLVLFVGTKRNCAESIKNIAQKLNMPYICNRWLGGILSNFREMRRSINLFNKLKEKSESQSVNKKHAVAFKKEINRKERRFGGISNLNRIPDLIFIVDAKKEQTAVKEAKLVNVPIIAIVDSNASDKNIDYPIYGNDDSKKAISFYLSSLMSSLEQKDQVTSDDTSNMKDASVNHQSQEKQ